MDRQPSFLGFADRLERWQHLIPCALLLVLTFALYYSSLSFDFVWDDEVYIHQNYRIQGLSLLHWSAIWSNTYLGHFAPIQHSVLAVLYHFFALKPFGYHLAQLSIHVLCVVLLYLLLKKLVQPRVAFIATLLFAVYPANIETVAWISETKSTLALLFFLLSFLAFLRFREREHWVWGILCGALLLLSWLSKVSTIVAPAIFFLYDYWQGNLRKRQLKSAAAFFLLAGAFTVVHMISFYGSGKVAETDYFVSPSVHILNIPSILSFYLKMSVYPHPLSAWQMMLISEKLNWVLAIGWLALLVTAVLLLRANRFLQFWALWFFLFLLPVLGFVPFGIWVADRYLYIPVVGAFVILSHGFFWLADRLTRAPSRWVLNIVFCALIAAFAWHTVRHLPVWKDDLSLWQNAITNCSTSAYCHVNLGLAYMRSGQTNLGVPELIRAVEIRPAPLYLTYLGDAYTMSVKDYRQAGIAYQMARDQGGPDIDAKFYFKLARYHLLAGNSDAARKAISDGKKISLNEPGLHVVESILEWKSGNLDAARRSLTTVLTMTQRRADLPGFLRQFWPLPIDNDKLLSDLRSSQSEPRP
ncbi:MAG: hypothetical protein A3F68_13120 [Acidobacteria bacterium RIFCSPLOWO2_12_FULL_54_10]|nr:MAG: hypothetical protein A3F68_13120 [Acidobacteria bacterium RIFCSPLOWO2_12_FULL_54_10]